jgi:hypothetical protein
MKQLTPRNRKWWTLGLAIVATLFAVVTKLALTTGPLLPGLDGAYYWVQVRSILEHSTLAFNDLPLVFWIQAGLAALIGNIPLSVRLTDAILPALAAIPLFLMTKNAKQMWLPAVAILVVLLNPIQLYFFTGDFIKNAATIPVVFYIAYLLLNWNKRSLRFSIAALAVSFVVLTLSHFGTLLLGLGLIAIWLLLQLRQKHWRFWLIAGVSGSVTIGIVLAGLAILVPTRFDRLINFITTNAVFFQPAWQMMLQGRTDPVMIITCLVGQLGTVALGWVSWRIRREMTFSAKSLIGASLVLTFVLSSPLLGMEWFDRLAALSFVPLSIAMLIVWENLNLHKLKVAVTTLPVIILIGSLVMFQVGAKKPVLSGSQYVDFETLTTEVQIPLNSIVVARHGLEYLIAWKLQTDVVQDSSYQGTDTSSYDSVYYLLEKHPDAGQGPGNGGKSPLGSDKPPLPSGNVDSKSTQVAGTTVYENASFSLIKVR